MDKLMFLQPKQTIVLTANRRQSLFLSRHFLAEKNQSSGWLPKILPLTEWCQAQYEKLLLQADEPLPSRLTELQTEILWQQQIPESDFAHQAYLAWEWLQQWQLPLAILKNDASMNQDVQWFYQQAKLFQKNYLTDQWRTPAQVINILLQQSMTLPAEIILFGFNDFSPQIKQLIRHWQQQGVQVQIKRQLTVGERQCQRVTFLDEAEEWYAMAEWANQMMMQNKKVACVIPDVQQSRLQIMRVFQQFPAKIDIALGRPLSESFNFNRELATVIFDSKLFQLPSEWGKLLKLDLTELDHLLGKINGKKAKNLIQFFATKTIKQQVVAKPAIAILGLLEAASLSFDALWMMGLNAETWPKPPKPNPFLPLYLQRAEGMPHSSYERERLFAKQLTRSLTRSANTVMLSCVKAPSQFILRYPEIKMSGQSPLLNQVATWSLEKIKDDQAPVVRDLFLADSELLRDQSVCPFRAFAHYRLHARFVIEEERRRYSRERGLVVHEILQHYYSSEKKDLSESIQRVLKKTSWPKVYQQLEKIRLENLLLNFLEIEKKRAPFKVKACELKHTFQLHPQLQIRARMDRIDELEDQRYEIIDYKTGDISIKGWMDERLTAPQLPLYHLYDKTRVEKISLVQLQTQSVKFRSLVTQDYSDVWLAQLKNLAEEFIAGVARVDPVDPNEHCQYCNLHVLCRVYE